MPDSNEFRFRNRGETLEYRRGAHIFHFDVTWSLHVRLFVDPDLVTVECRRVDATERRAVLNEVLDFLRTQSQDPIEVVGEPGLGDQVRYTVSDLSAHAGAQHSDVLFDLTRSTPGGETRAQAMRRLDDVLSASDAELLPRLRSA